MKVLTAVLLLISLQCSCAVSPTDCNAVEPVAEKAVDLINKWRRDGYLFQLLRVADAHLDKAGSTAVYYLVLDVKESDCWVLSKNQENCVPAEFRRPSDTVIGQCKVIATKYSHESQDLRMHDFNCTTSSVSSALGNSKDSPVILDFLEDTELYREQADKALDKYKSENSDFDSFRVDRIERVARAKGGERTKYYLDFSVRNCSTQHFPRHPKIFGFCRADLSYDAGASDLEAPEKLDVTCEVVNFEEHKNISGMRPHWGPPHHLDGPGHSPAGDHHHPHKPHKLGFRPPPEGKDNSDRPPLQEGAFPPLPPPGSRCPHPHFGTNETHRHPHNHNSSDKHHPGPHPHGHGPHGHGPHGHGPHGHGPHGHGPHGHGPHGHGPHGHGPHGHGPHGHGPHGHGPHGHGPHGHGPHGHGPHGHGPHGPGPHGHDFDDFGPCDPPPPGQGPPDHHHHGHGPPHRHSGKRGPGKGHFPFHRRQIGFILQLPPLNINEVLPLPEANFPIFSLPNCNNPLHPEIQPFPQSASESCPGKFKSEFLYLSKFFAYTSPK